MLWKRPLRQRWNVVARESQRGQAVGQVELFDQLGKSVGQDQARLVSLGAFDFGPQNPGRLQMTLGIGLGRKAKYGRRRQGDRKRRAAPADDRPDSPAAGNWGTIPLTGYDMPWQRCTPALPNPIPA